MSAMIAKGKTAIVTCICRITNELSVSGRSVSSHDDNGRRNICQIITVIKAKPTKTQ